MAPHKKGHGSSLAPMGGGREVEVVCYINKRAENISPLTFLSVTLHWSDFGKVFVLMSEAASACALLSLQ